MQVHGLALFGFGPGIGNQAMERRNVLVSGTMADSMYDFRTVFWRNCRGADGSSAYPKAVDRTVEFLTRSPQSSRRF